MKSMTARYPGTCAACHAPIKVGAPINFFGRGHAEHQTCTKDRGHTEDPETAALLRADRQSYRNGISVARFSSGAVVTQNRRGRCEDAPCCGCCT